jgi:hypothetical protein
MLYKISRFFDRVSNRFLSLIILLLFWVWAFIYFTFVYLPNKSENERILNESLSWSWLKSIELVKIENNTQNLEINSQDKINSIREKLDYYKVIDLGTDKFYFSQDDNKIVAKINSKIISIFDYVLVNDIFVDKVYSSNNDFLFKIWDDIYLYNKNTDILNKIDLFVDIKYVKREDNIFIFVTNIWSYLFDLRNKNFEYFNFFEDFVYYNDSYIWIIKKDDIRRINNLWLWKLSKNSIYFYNPSTKERKSLYETNLNLEKIYYENGEIFFIDSKNDVYKLENF